MIRDVTPVFGCEFTTVSGDEPLAELHKNNVVIETKSTVLKETVIFASDEYREKYRGDKIVYTYRDLYRLAKWKPASGELMFLHAVLRTFPQAKIEGIKRTGKDKSNG